MTPEQIERVMELVRRYGTECFGEGGAKSCEQAERILAEIEAELKGGGTE